MGWRCWTRRALGVCLATFALLATTPQRASASVPILVLDGTGHGHGVGLSQWGAEYLARTGQPVEAILSTFYPGAGLGKATGSVRVTVHQPPTTSTTLTFPDGGEVRSPLEGEQASGFPVRVGRGGRVRITFDGSYRVDALMSGQNTAEATRYQQDPCTLFSMCAPTTTVPAPTTTTTAPPTTTTAPPADPGAPPPTSAPADGPTPSAAASSSSVWAVPVQGGVTTVDDRGRSYRGVIEATGEAALRLTNVIGVEDYLRGMAEVPGNWPPAAVQAQTVAARTYALRAMRSGGELCDDERCQVYVGRGAESAGQNAAVEATSRSVLTYGGALAAAVYSADAGGVSATTLEGFGTPDGVYPYLTTVRYETDNPLPWHVEVALTDVAARLGYPGGLTGVRMSQAGPSGRALELVLEGAAGDRTVSGIAFARALGLRSTRFTVAAASADTAPPPPPMEDTLQALPDEATSLVAPPALASSDERVTRRVRTKPAAARTVSPGLDPRRHPATLLAVLLVAGAVGAHLPLALAGRSGRARPWASWRFPTRNR